MNIKRLKITRGGQVSIPAAVRRRWATRTVSVEDHDDYLVLQPAPDDPVKAARGALAGRIRRSSKEIRRRAREDEKAAEARRRG